MKAVLHFTRFKLEFQELILSYITTARLAVCWNGEQLEPFEPLCVMYGGVEPAEDKNWSPVSLTRNDPKVSHIFFVDDLLLFGETSYSQAKLIEHLVARFCGFSGQRINRIKSHIWFSPNTPSYIRTTICS